MATNKIPGRATSRYAGQYAGPGDPNRLVEIFTDSHKLAMSSKNPETATTRFELAVEAYHQLMSMGITKEVRTSVHDAMSSLAKQFPTQVVVNEAQGLRDKAVKMKTVRKKLELLRRARDVLERGRAADLEGSRVILDAVEEVRVDIAELEAATT